MKQADLARLDEADRCIREISLELGLEPMAQEFDVVPAQKMLEIMAYRLPVNFSHWSFGRDYENERTRYEHGYAVPYEVVFNAAPCRAYLMDTNPFPIQVMVMAHVYAHNDFMRSSRHFQRTRRDMISSASEAAARFRGYEEDYGLERVERLIDAGMAVQWNIDPDRDLHRETEEQARDRLYGYRRTVPGAGPYDDLLPPPERADEGQKRRLRRKSPPEPTVDLLGYLISHSPRPLDDWERDVLSVIKEQAAYFMPYRRTKIMNEGWATYWHEKIMQVLFRRGFLNAEEHGFYNVYNARVKAHSTRTLNPYLLGHALFRSIEDRWNRGRFGREFEELETAGERESWDTGLGQGKEKITQVRSTYMDWFFVDEFLDREVVEELELFFYLDRDRETFYESVVEETDWRRVKRILVRSLMNWGVPRILVEDGNYRNSLQLYLRHQYEGIPLDEEYARRTLEHIYHLWDRPVHLETRVPVQGGASDQRRVYHADEDGVRVTTG